MNMTHKYYNRFLLGVALCLTVGTGLAQAGAGPAFGAAEYGAAYGDVTAGKPYDAAIRLIELLRSVPGDDVRLADQMVGPAQLLGFCIASLMDWPDRTRLLTEVLKPEEYESDKLLIAVMQAGSGIQSMAFPAATALKQIAGSTHRALGATAVCILAEPHYYGKSEYRPMVAQLAMENPDLETARRLIEAPVIKALGDAVKGGTARGDLLSSAAYFDGGRSGLLAVSPGLARAAEALPSMDARDITAESVAAWSAALTKENTPGTRYTLVGFLACTGSTAERRVAMRAGLEALAALPPATPDVLRADMVLADNAIADNDFPAMLAHATALLSLDILPCTAERSMYEASMQTAQKAAKRLTRFGRYSDAASLHTRLAAKYPSSTLAASELEQAGALQNDPAGTALAIIRGETDALKSFGKYGEARRVYQEILDNAAQPDLKAAVARELEELPVAGQPQ